MEIAVIMMIYDPNNIRLLRILLVVLVVEEVVVVVVVLLVIGVVVVVNRIRCGMLSLDRS